MNDVPLHLIRDENQYRTKLQQGIRMTLEEMLWECNKGVSEINAGWPGALGWNQLQDASFPDFLQQAHW